MIKNSMRALFALALLAVSLVSNAQFVPGQVLTASQLNNAFATMLPRSGGTLTGALSGPTANFTSGVFGSATISGGTIAGLSSPIGFASGGTNATTALGATAQLQFQQPSGVVRSVAAKLGDFVNALDYGATCTGAGNDTAAIQAAVATGKEVTLPPGTCVVTDAITLATQGQIVRGSGRKRTIISVPATFNMSALGVFVAPNTGPSSSNAEGPQFRDFKITFAQPDVAVRANLTTYPPALYLQNSPRFTVANLQISEATTGIDMRGDSGGAHIDNVEMSAYGIGINIDGSTDSVRITNFHFWPFDLTTNQYTVWNDGTQTALQSGRCDDLHVTDLLVYASKVKFIQTSSGNTFGVVSGMDLDTYGGLIMQAGSLSISSSIFSVIRADQQALLMTGGLLTCSSCVFYGGVALTNPLVQVSGAGTYLQIGQSRLQITGDMQALSASSSGLATVVLSGNQFMTPANPTMSNAVVRLGTGSRGTLVGNRITDLGTGSGTFISVAADDQHIIANNASAGWAMALPATASNLTVLNNSNVGGGAKNVVQGTMTLLGAGTTPAKTLSVESGALLVRNNAGTQIGSLDDNGNFSITGGMKHGGADFDGSYAFSQPASGATVTMGYGNQTAIIAPSATIASLTITLPACNSGYDGGLARYAATQAITSLTVNASSGAVSNAPTTLAAGAGHAYLCRGANSTWYPLY
ncbi:glycosyl hydrolase family 28-related protein [Burkholderia gladioli]|uniref:glycosyl hydrolase family 28-related protein n=1 Tax=Burkholderia gladioli TaxID=28095 RepID=UPI00164216AE|nr:glycosyl hydrolase family 28-related protein [Burkholderia gladioli]